MIKQINSLLTPPVFEYDEEQTHRARLLYVNLWTLILAYTSIEIMEIFLLP